MDQWRGRAWQPPWHRVNGILTRQDGVSSVELRRQCHKCGQRPAGPGNILCGQCKTRIQAAACVSSE